MRDSFPQERKNVIKKIQDWSPKKYSYKNPRLVLGWSFGKILFENRDPSKNLDLVLKFFSFKKSTVGP